MKRTLALLLSFVLLVSTLAGCSNTPVTDTWDGSIATGFAGGDGSESNPYQITSGAQLAYLAEQTNEGTSFTGQYFVLQNNLDLANIEWTPIGHCDHPFDGNFDGKGHTISNLNLTEPHKHNHVYSHITVPCGSMGLFGICGNVNIGNINIAKAFATVENVWAYNQLWIGVLIGGLTTYQSALIHHVNIRQATVSPHHIESEDARVLFPYMAIGGTVGNVYIDGSAQVKLEALQADVSVSCEEGRNLHNRIGGIVGNVTNTHEFEASDLASYLTVLFQEQSGYNTAGAFGYLSTSQNTARISNVFSHVRTNRDLYGSALNHPSYLYSHEIHALMGSSGTYGLFELENVFGYVEPIDETADFSEPRYSLHPEEDNKNEITATNCQGTDSLPDDHGFSKDIWDLSDPAAPVLK